MFKETCGYLYFENGGNFQTKEQRNSFSFFSGKIIYNNYDFITGEQGALSKYKIYTEKSCYLEQTCINSVQLP